MDNNRSIIKSGYRINNEIEADKKKKQVSDELNENIRQQYSRQIVHEEGTVVSVVVCGLPVFSFVCGIIVMLMDNGFLNGVKCGFLLGLLIFLSVVLFEKVFNKSIDKEIDKLRQNAQWEISKIDEEAKKKTEQQILLYESNVTASYKKIIANLSNIEPMVTHSIIMFKRMLSHADSESNRRFVECDFVFEVTLQEIKYIYSSGYTNPKDDFNFDKKRFHSLHNDFECEALAKALSKAISRDLKKIYPPNSVNITINHVDAKVTLGFKMPNNNFVAAKDII